MFATYIFKQDSLLASRAGCEMRFVGKGGGGRKKRLHRAKRKTCWKNSNKIRESTNINLFRNDITRKRETYVRRTAKTESISKAYLNTNARNSSSPS